MSTTAKIIGIIIDTNLKPDKYINNTYNSAYFHIKTLQYLCSFLSEIKSIM